MNKLNHYSYSGHCYPDLVEKIEGKVVAQMRANLWKDDYLRINENFLTKLKEPLKDGINILFNAIINFDPVHGFSLKIIDIDPVFSLGELEREKLETIERLKNEGIFHLNKGLRLPLLPQRIAVISVETSKGYSDFLNIIKNNAWGYKFFCFLFPALLQGDKSVDSILTQLKRVRKVKSHFDVVAIIRGGGGDVGLSSYNNYQLAKEIAGFPIPVLTGIGHSTNETVAEMIAFKNAITPTELADFLIQQLHNFSVPLQKSQEILLDRAHRILGDEKLTLFNTIRYFRSVAGNHISKNQNEFKTLTNKLSQHSTYLLNREKEHCHELFYTDLRKAILSFANKQRLALLNIEKTLNILDPAHILRRGFTITLRNGKTVKSIKEVASGDVITTITADGTMTSTVINSKQSGEV